MKINKKRIGYIILLLLLNMSFMACSDNTACPKWDLDCDGVLDKEECPKWDFNCDGVVDRDDLVEFYSNYWLCIKGRPCYCPDGNSDCSCPQWDFDCNGIVDYIDLHEFKKHLGCYKEERCYWEQVK